jgi:hypothetical protein
VDRGGEKLDGPGGPGTIRERDVSFRRDRIGLTDRGETGREGKEGVAASTTSSGSASPLAEEETKQGFTPGVPERKWSAN